MYCSRLAAFDPKLIIFDKDGTLIDFHAMWAGWATDLARRLEAVIEQPITPILFKAMDFDPHTGHIVPGGRLADWPMADLRLLTIEVLQSTGLSPQAIDKAITEAWHVPDPVALAQPLADLSGLFTTIRAQGAKIAIATSDDRAPTEKLLATWHLAPMVDALVCADDGLPIKPAPDMILTICDRLNLAPATSVMIGDNPADLRMGRAAGVGLNIGVLSGISTAQDLEAEADMLLTSIAELVESQLL